MKIFQIFKKDLKNIIKNPAAIGIIIGLCIIPSLYAWITLKANWNPYVDTGNVPVAVVNNDTGTIVNNKIVNFGTETVKELENNKTIKWTFVGQKVADQGLKDGSYYAVIEIPSDFSTDLESGITGNPIKPELIYKVNEKTNAIATKITDLATGQLQQEIKETFLYTVTNVVLKQANALGKKLSTNKPMILQVKNVIANTNENIGNIISNINSSSTNVGQLGAYIGELKNNLPEVTKEINNLEGVVSSSKYLIEATQTNMKNIENSLNSTNTSMSSANNSLQSFVTSLKNTVNTQEQINQNAINSANNAVNTANNTVTNATNTAKNTIEKNSGKVNTVVNNAKDTAKKNLDTAKVVNDNAKTALNTGKKVVDGVQSKEASIANDTKKVADKINTSKAVKDVTNKEPSSAQVNKVINKVAYLNKEQIEKDKQILNNALTANKNLSSLIGTASQFLNALDKINGNDILSELINDLNTLQGTVQNQSSQLNDLNQTLSDTSNITADMINSKLDNISELSTEINSLFGSFTGSYSNTVNSSLTNISSNLNNSLNNINSVLLASKQMIPQLDSIANMGISSSNLTVSKINDLKSKLDGLKTNLDTLENKTGSLTSASLDNLVNLLNKNPQQLATLLASPIGINVQELYGMSIFGIGLAPFYTVLAIWVGALLCTTIIGVNDKAEENGTKKRVMEIHFGKMLLFLSINFIQATIVTLGDIFILGIKPADFWLLMAFAWISGLVFTVIIFTLVSLNGNFGKAGALVIMVIQVAGSGAIYPIEVNPIFFQKLEFLWPFTYAIDGFRQAIGGPDWSQVSGDIIALVIFLVIFIVMGFSKMFINKQIDYIENAFKESEL